MLWLYDFSECSAAVNARQVNNLLQRVRLFISGNGTGCLRDHDLRCRVPCDSCVLKISFKNYTVADYINDQKTQGDNAGAFLRRTCTKVEFGSRVWHDRSYSAENGLCSSACALFICRAVTARRTSEEECCEGNTRNACALYGQAKCLIELYEMWPRVTYHRMPEKSSNFACEHPPHPSCQRYECIRNRTAGGPFGAFIILKAKTPVRSLRGFQERVLSG